MLRLTLICLIAASLLALFLNRASAHRPSFPIEITGTVINFDRANQIFTIRADEPARILTIAVGRDCKFKRGGALTGEEILKKGARVRISYFATIFTGNIAVETELNSMSGQKAKGRR